MRINLATIFTGVSAIFPFAFFGVLTLVKAFMMDPVIGWFMFSIMVITGLSVLLFQEKENIMEE